jgi:hypothetical protein
MLVLVSVALVAMAFSPFAHGFASLTIYGYNDKAQYKPGETGTLTFWIYNDGTDDLILKNVTIFYPWYSVIWGGNLTISGQDAVINPQGNWTTSLTFTIPNDGRATSGNIHINVVLRWAATTNRAWPNVSRIIPGDWGKTRPGWLVGSLGNRGRKIPVGEAGFTSSSGDVRASSVTRKGTERRGAMRNRAESSQVVRESFAPGRIAVTQRVNGCY